VAAQLIVSAPHLALVAESICDDVAKVLSR